jgi:hypothetical protein
MDEDVAATAKDYARGAKR